MKSCVNCAHCSDEKFANQCEGCQGGKHWKAKPITNADRIRAMSDEELAGLFGKYVYCGLCPLMHRCIAGECNKVVMEWLQQPAEGE